MAEAWAKEGEGEKERLVPEEFALHSGIIWGATKLAAMEASPLVIQQEGRWSSSAFMAHMRANMEDP